LEFSDCLVIQRGQLGAPFASCAVMLGYAEPKRMQTALDPMLFGRHSHGSIRTTHQHQNK